MPFIDPVPEDEAAGEVAALYERARAEQGHVPNTVRAFSHRPSLLAAWGDLRKALTSRMDARRYELVTLAAAQRLRSSYCALAHGQILATTFYDDDAVRKIATDRTAAGLDEVDVAAMDLAAKVAGEATSVEQADIERLRRLGLGDDEIFDVVAAAAARCFFSKILDALDFQPDAAYAELDPALREALVVGRPIAEG